MNELIEITWSAASIDEARKVCRFLVQEKKVACAQMIPWMESIYLWDNQIETAQESRVVMKTSLEMLDSVCQVILKNTRYEIPEILWRPINSLDASVNLGGNQSYMEWINSSIQQKINRP